MMKAVMKQLKKNRRRRRRRGGGGGGGVDLNLLWIVVPPLLETPRE
jgi:hypothetical protein